MTKHKSKNSDAEDSTFLYASYIKVRYAERGDEHDFQGLGAMKLKSTTQDFDLEAFRARVQKGNDPHGPVRETLNRLGDRWTPLILQILRTGTIRYTQLLKEINSMADSPVSQRILTLKLRACERDGFIKRTVIPTVPPQVEYSLSDLGMKMVAELDKLICWIELHTDMIYAARQDYDLLHND